MQRKEPVAAPTTSFGSAHQTSALLREHYDRHKADLSRSELTVADYFLSLSIDELIFRSAEQLAAATGTSDATVIRAARKLGFSGLPELKRLSSRTMARTAPTPERLAHRFRATGTDLNNITEQIFRTGHEILDSTQERLDVESLSSAISILEQADIVWCLGFGTSEIEAKHCAIELSRIGLRTRYSGSSGFSLASELIELRNTDVILMFQSGRDVAELRLVVDQIDKIGCQVILVCGVRLTESYGDKVSAVLTCVGTASGLASWTIGAVIITDILAYSIATRNQQLALTTKQRLADLRAPFTS
jgi:DNA-binding MurR/RpiR family transcriptional regulator